MAKYMLRSILGLLLVVNLVTAEEWNFEFGQRVPLDYPVYEKDGEIGLFSYKNYYKIEVPMGTELTHVRVTVWSLSPPKVNLDKKTNTVEILFSWVQITACSYKIEVDGIQIFRSGDTKLSRSGHKTIQLTPIRVEKKSNEKKARVYKTLV